MKVFFTATYSGINQFNSSYQKIFSLLEEFGLTNVDEEIKDITYNKYINYIKKSKANQEQSVNLTITQIKKADICVYEVSAHSLGVGFIIQKSLELCKPTIILYQKGFTPYFLAGVKDEKLIICEYQEKNLKRVLKSALALAKERRDKRFNFYLSTKLLEHVDTLSQEEGVTKSKIMRDIILRDMRQRGKISAAEFEEELG